MTSYSMPDQVTITIMCMYTDAVEDPHTPPEDILERSFLNMSLEEPNNPDATSKQALD